MTNEQTLLKKVAEAIINNPPIETMTDDEIIIDWSPTAQAAIDAIRSELAEPNDAMKLVVSKNWGRRTWDEYREVIAASPIGRKAVGMDNG